MKNMKHFGVHRDLESYRALVDVMPKGKMVAVNLWQKAFQFYPKQQDCIVELMSQMEENKVIPDEGTFSRVRQEDDAVYFLGDTVYSCKCLNTLMFPLQNSEICWKTSLV